MARRALITAAIAAVAAALLVAPAAPARAEAVGWWPSEGYTVTNNGFNPNETAIRVPTVGGLVAKSATTPERRGQGAPVVGHGRVFVPDALGITAYDEITGAQLWRWENDAERSLTPILALTGDGKLVAVTRYAAVDYSSHALVVFDEVTGEALVNTGIEVEGFAWRLLVDGDFVVVSGENRHALDTHTYRLSTGALLWEHDLYMYQPVSAGGRLLVRGWRDNVLTSEILDIATGAARFGVQHRGYDVLAANDAGTKFYVTWGHSLQVLDANTGALSWLASNVYASYGSVSPTRLYVVSARDQKISAFDANSGALFWSRTLAENLLKPVVAGGVLYATIEGDRVHTLNPVNGAPLAAPTLAGTVAPPVVTAGKLYVTNGSTLTTYAP